MKKRITMRPEIYKQYDDDWRWLPYPGSGSYLDDSGCGCLAVYHAAIELDPYKDLTVPQCRDYMVQFATVKNGTLWDGITRGLEHYGYNVHWREADDMDDIFRELKSSLNSGVILFAKKDAPSYGPDGTLWTKTGHYIYFGDYEIRSDGTHWFYLKDSGQRDHDGWYCFEKSMKGCCRNVWICKSAKDAPAPTPTPDDGHYKGLYPSVRLYLEPGDRGEQVTRLQKYVDWYFDGEFFKACGPADGVYGKNTLRWVNRMLTDFFGASEADGKVGPKTIARMKAYSKKDPKPTPTPSHKGEVLDVSDFQDDIDWVKAKADGIAGVIVRCGLRGGEKGDLRADLMFLKHIKDAYEAGIKVGVYMFTTAINAKEGKEEAVYAVNQIKKAGLPLSYPVAIDTENVFWKEKGERVAGRSNSTKLSKAKRTEAIKAFCEEMKAQGYEPMIYASLSWFKDCLDMSKLPYKVWVAQYNSTCQYEGEKALWQYTSTGRISGYGDVVDMNKCYLPDNYDPRIKPDPTPTPGKYTGPLPTEADIRTASRNGIIDGTINWARKIDADNFAYLWPQRPGCYFCGTIKKKAYTCMPLITAAYAHGGGDPDILAICKKKHSLSLHEDDSDWQYLIRKGKFKFLGRMSKLSWADIQPGDILIQYASDDNHGHMMEYIGNDKLFEAISQGCKITNGAKSRFEKYKKGASQCGQGSLNFVMRYTGSRTYLKKGDRGAAVTMLQDYLNWYFDGAFYKECGPADGVFGANTHKWVVKMQTDFFGAKEADGTIGNKTTAKMREVVR